MFRSRMHTLVHFCELWLKCQLFSKPLQCYFGLPHLSVSQRLTQILGAVSDQCSVLNSCCIVSCQFQAWATYRSAQEFIYRVWKSLSATPSSLNFLHNSTDGEEGMCITFLLHNCGERLGTAHSLCSCREEVPLCCSSNPEIPRQSSFSATFQVFCQLF